MSEPARERKGLLERLLGIVTDVRAGEGPLALVMTLNVFLLLTAYYVIKPVREALILSLESGAEYKSYMSAVIALALTVVVPLYGRVVDRLPRLRLVVGVTLFFASHLVLFYLGSRFATLERNMGLVFFVWVGMFNMMVVAQFWAFANDLYDADAGKRIFVLVALGATVGAVFGSGVTAWLDGVIGTFPSLLLSAALLGVCSLLFVVGERLSGAAKRARASRRHEPRPAAAGSGAGPYALVLRSKYLFAIALFTLAFTWANTNGEYMLSRLVKETATEKMRLGDLAPDGVREFIRHTYGEFYFGVNALGVLFQTLVVSRVVKHGGVTVALLVLPSITAFSATGVLVAPVLAVLMVGKTFENATDYSLNNTVRQMLWLPTTYEMKYKAKQAIDGVVVRYGDVLSGLLVFVGAGLLSWSVRAFALVNVLLVGFWLLQIARIHREGKALEEARAPSAPA